MLDSTERTKGFNAEAQRRKENWVYTLIAQNMSGNEAGDPLLGQKGKQNKDSFVFTP